MPGSAVYSHFDPTPLLAGGSVTPNTRRVSLAANMNAVGSPLQPGTLLGVRTIATYNAATASPKAGGNTGTGTIALGSPPTLANVIAGSYRVVFTSATAFQVSDPLGDQLATGVIGTPYATQIAFTIASGGTAFAIGDEFDITVTRASGAPFNVTAAATPGNAGNGALTLATPAFANNVRAGVYTLEMTGAATFTLFDPSGNPVATGSTGTPFSNQLAFTLNTGGSPFVGGDTFSITAAALAIYLPCVASASDGSQTPIAVLAQEADTSAGTVLADAYFSGEFNYEVMTIDASWTADALNAALLLAGTQNLSS